ncbi:hypothetical protein GGS20DRAFT_595396 [Poronia punctata]|nr:hypothetical protein GGS20DRAFT_595396 [Poronia punctata]
MDSSVATNAKITAAQADPKSTLGKRKAAATITDYFRPGKRPVGSPPISSHFRGGMCDALPWWKKHQGGVYTMAGIAKGMLLCGPTTPRDVVQNQVIITTCGGGFKSGPKGELIRTADQPDTLGNVAAFLRTYEAKLPIGVVAGKSKTVGKAKAGPKVQYINTLFDVQFEHQYNVLDWFYITKIWSEYGPVQADGQRYKHSLVRLEKIDLDLTSWWSTAAKATMGMYKPGEWKTLVFDCNACKKPSTQLFNQGWCCLEKDCEEFFAFKGADVNFDTLTYTQAFLNERQEWVGEKPQPLQPGLPALEPGQFGCEKEFKRGIVCPTCRWATRRIDWDGWRCEKGCGFTHLIPLREVPVGKINEETDAVMLSTRHEQFSKIDPGMVFTDQNVPGYATRTFYLHGSPTHGDENSIIGGITVMSPTQQTLERPGGINDLYTELQETTRSGDINLRRHAARCPGSHMEEITSHFSCNMGADYKFGVVVKTSRGFDTAPDAVMKALGRLTWAGKTAINLINEDVTKESRVVDRESMPDEFIDFNEQLILGYFEDCKIGFHDDGEKELGPTVATMSVGSPSVMKFRRKVKKNKDEPKKSNPPILEFVCLPGTVVIMHGSKIHRYYEHGVDAKGVLRYALTCRFINPDTIDDPVRRARAIKNGEVPEEWKQRAYKGEEAEVDSAN